MNRSLPAGLLCPWGFSRQEYWSGLPCPPPGDLLNPGIEPTSLMSPPMAGGFFTLVPPGMPLCNKCVSSTALEVLEELAK